jgi:hypothetical protein
MLKTVLTRFIKSFKNPPDITPVQRRNFTNVQIDAIGVGLANAASPFLPVFLTRLGATSFEVGLLTAMPAVTGLILAIPIGQFLQNQRKIVPWFSTARLGVIACYALTGLAAFFFREHSLVIGILLIWALATIPQTMLAITFSVVMNAVAGPNHRFDLMTRRWSTLGLTTSITVFLIGQILDRLDFPFNYQIVFIVLSLGGLVSYYFSSRITLSDIQAHRDVRRMTLKEQLREYVSLISKEKPFQAFVIKRFIFLSGATMALPVLPLYLVRKLNASDSWIAAINTAQTAILIIGYFLWTHQSRKRGTRVVLLWTTLGTALYPIFVALTDQVWLITLFAGVNGIFQAGLNLVFFDELMKTVPDEYSSTFVSLAQGLQYLSTIVSPLVGTILGDKFGLGVALAVSGSLQLIGFSMFALNWPRNPLRAPFKLKISLFK